VLEERKLALNVIVAHAATLLFLLIYFWVFVITAVDQALFYAVFPYRYFVAIALVLLLALTAGHHWRFKLGLVLILVFWFSLLPRVSWHEETHFFINAGTLRKGMKIEQALARMRPFVVTASADGKEIWFQPSLNSPDACIGYVRDGKIREVILRSE